MAVTVGTPASLYAASGFPATTSFTMDAGGADALVVFIYSNSVPSPANLSPTFGGFGMGTISEYTNPAGSTNGWLGTYVQVNPGTGTKTLSTGSWSGGERFIMAVPVSGVDISTTAAVVANFANSNSTGNTVTHGPVSGNSGDVAIDVLVRNFNNTATTLSSPTATTLVDNNVNSPLQFLSRTSTLTGSSVTYTWACSNGFNPATGITLVLSNGTPAAPTGYKGAILADAPQAYYRLGEATGLPQDSSGNAQHAISITGAPNRAVASLLADRSDAAIQFNGSVSTDYVIVPTLTFTGSFTIEAIIKPTVKANGDASQTIFSAYQADVANQSMSFGIVRATNLLRMSFFGTDLDSTGTTLADNTTYRVACRYDASIDTATLLINGVEIISSAAGPFIPTGTVTCYIGSRGGIEIFEGVIDELAIWTSALSTAQLLNHRNADVIPRTKMRWRQYPPMAMVRASSR